MPDPSTSAPRATSSFLAPGPLIGFLLGLAAALLLSIFPPLFTRLVDAFPPLVLLIVWLVFWRLPRSAEPAEPIRAPFREFRLYHRIVLVFLLAAALAFVFFYMRLSQPSLYDTVCLAFFPLMAAAVIAYGAGWLNLNPSSARHDEQARLFRARASRAGYVVLMAMLGLTYLVMVYEPTLVSLLLRLAFFLGVGIPVAIFLALEWWAAGKDQT